MLRLLMDDMAKSNRTNQTEKRRVVEISLQKALAVFLGAVVTGVVGGIFAGISILNNDHFALATLSTRVNAMEKDMVPRTEFELQITNLGQKIDTNNDNIEDNKDYLIRIEGKLDTVIQGR